MNSFLNRCLGFVVAATLVTIAIGCGTSSTDHAEEVEHTRPEHWPNTFADGVADIERHFDEFASGSLPAKNEAELRDLLKWLPDLAGDTSLDEANWTRAVDAGRELELALAGQAEASDAIATLKDVAKLTADDLPPFVPGRHTERPVTADDDSSVNDAAESSGEADVVPVSVSSPSEQTETTQKANEQPAGDKP